MVELTVLQAAASPNESRNILREAAEFYKVDVGAITAKVKLEFATKDKAKVAKTATPKPTEKGTKIPWRPETCIEFIWSRHEQAPFYTDYFK